MVQRLNACISLRYWELLSIVFSRLKLILGGGGGNPTSIERSPRVSIPRQLHLKQGTPNPPPPPTGFALIFSGTRLVGMSGLLDRCFASCRSLFYCIMSSPPLGGCFCLFCSSSPVVVGICWFVVRPVFVVLCEV